jgi:hypothetical protein
MKTKLIFFVYISLHFLTSIRLTAQENAYLKNNPIWQLNSSCSIGGFCIQNELFNYYTKNDTLIDSVKYVEIFRKGQGSFTWNAGGNNMGCVGNFVNIDAVPKFFLRSLDKQMYVRYPGDSLEQLLYDFNLNVGDTLPLTYNNFFKDIYVTAIDSIYTAFGYRKRFTLGGSTWATHLIEGIGHSRGLVEPLKVSPTCTYILNCYSINDTSYYPTVGATCNVAIGIATLTTDNAVTFFPNPLISSTLFTFSSAQSAVLLKLFNSLGECVKTVESTHAGSLLLNRNELVAGFYFYELSTQQQIFAKGKLLISDF